jgi:hypothetical protein
MKVSNIQALPHLAQARGGPKDTGPLPRETVNICVRTIIACLAERDW